MYERIIEKAEKKLGFKTYSNNIFEKLEEVATHVGIDNFNPEQDLDILEKTLDSLIEENEMNSKDDGDMEYLGEEPDENSGYEEVYQPDSSENLADKNGMIKNNDEAEADPQNEKLNSEEQEKNNKTQTKREDNIDKPNDNKDTKNEGVKSSKDDNLKQKENSENLNRSNNANSNKFKKENGKNKLPQNTPGSKQGLNTRFNNAQNKLNKIAHPGQSLKSKGKTLVQEGGKKASKAAGNAAKVAGKAVGKATKAAGKAIAKFIASNPYVLLILLAISFVVFLILVITAATGNEYSADGSEYSYLDKTCDFNNSKIMYKFCNTNSVKTFEIDEFILDQIAMPARGQLDYLEHEKLKALIIVMKTKILSLGDYNSETKYVTIDGCDFEHYEYQNIQASTYSSILDEVKDYLYISKSFSGAITDLSKDNDLEVNVLTFPEGTNYEEILKTAYQNDDLSLYSISNNCKTYIYGTGNKGFWWPIGSKEETASTIYGGTPTSTNISSYYGMRIHPIYKVEKMHNGIDISGGCDQVIIATKAGEITNVVRGCEIGGCDGYGNYIIIKHGDEIVSVYAHMKTNSATVNVGDKVVQGQKIGLVGTTGTSSGCHLHFEIRNNGAKTNPLDYVSTTEPR